MSTGDSPFAIMSGFTYSIDPANAGRYSSANVDFPEPFGPATTWHTGCSPTFNFQLEFRDWFLAPKAQALS